MEYQEAINWLFSQVPFYQKQGKSAYKADLSNITKLCEALGNPQNGLKYIHIAGTNGKGSVCHMTASVLQEAGLKVGLYTSPHLLDFRERIRLNGEMIPETYVLNFIEKNGQLIKETECSFFEATTALMFAYFSEEKPDIILLETGLGGRLDSTNIIQAPLIAALTNIGLDHTNILGNSIEKIASEKAGIIKEESVVAIGVMPQEVERIFVNTAESKNCEFINVANFSSLASDLKGAYQQENTKLVQAIIHSLNMHYSYQIHYTDIKRGLANVVKNTRLKGRWELFASDPKVILDTGHNPNGIQSIIRTLENESYNRLHWVFGAMADKDIELVVDLLPIDAQYYLCQINNKRSLSLKILSTAFAKAGLKFSAANSPSEAYFLAKKNASKDDLILLAGSTFLVAEFLEEFS
jgi:dihydrofolate synthase/folylpolyglutamate synthase